MLSSFWRKLEIGSDILEEHHRDLESEMRDLTSLLQEISTSPISNVWEVRRLIKGVIHPVLPDDPCQPLSTPPETAITEGRRKMNSTKRDKSHWEYVSIAHRKIGKSSGSGLGSNPRPSGRGRPPRSGRSRGRGRSSGRSSLSTVKNVVGDGNCGFRVVSNFLFGDENHWVEIRRRISYDLRHRMHVYEHFFGSVERVSEFIMKTNWEEGSALPEYWMNTADHLYVIANTSNLCVVFLARWMLFASITGAIEISSRYAKSLRWHGGSYRDIISTGNIPGILNPRELAGMAGTLVHDSISKCKGASSHSASVKVFLRTYILLFDGQRASQGWIGWAGIHCLKSNCLSTRSGMYGSMQSKYAMNPCHVET
ncbi:hypothetical protein M9H77_28239 [Catharanthus roseus]|uniref:Uncharacterized protein n=1 Tax=Catharanthus roseus TaxID=4058 RepID=A0ACC0AIX0_CATRO|nr:hypothetical protein M9H77_28239 [Catharanthus roseus]